MSGRHLTRCPMRGRRRYRRCGVTLRVKPVVVTVQPRCAFVCTPAGTPADTPAGTPPLVVTVYPQLTPVCTPLLPALVLEALPKRQSVRLCSARGCRGKGGGARNAHTQTTALI